MFDFDPKNLGGVYSLYKYLFLCIAQIWLLINSPIQNPNEFGSQTIFYLKIKMPPGSTFSHYFNVVVCHLRFFHPSIDNNN